MKYIDIHCHLQFPEYDADREGAINRAQKEEIGIINVGTDIPMSEKAIELAERHENMWATAAIHPNHAKEIFDFSALEDMAKHPKVVAIGECGLDYFHSEPEDMEKQREVFIQHIELANKVNKPLMLHIRNGKDNLNAYREAVEILKGYSRVRANFHFFAGNIEDLKSIVDLNCTVSFTGVVTFARNYDEVLKSAPIDRIMSETDAPYVAPVPNRGKRNEPLFIKDISHAMASIRGEDESVFLPKIVDNARKMFGI
ncbi:MAG: TatD family hydrolase [bacterium]|nr:TatD family hydrolase [bacterium]